MLLDVSSLFRNYKEQAAIDMEILRVIRADIIGSAGDVEAACRQGTWVIRFCNVRFEKEILRGTEEPQTIEVVR